jgi:hypothetical protein
MIRNGVRDRNAVVLISEFIFSVQGQILPENTSFPHGALHCDRRALILGPSFIPDVFRRRVGDSSVKAELLPVYHLRIPEMLQAAGCQHPDEKAPQPLGSARVVILRRPDPARGQIVHVLSLVADLVQIHTSARKYGDGQISAVRDLDHPDAILKALRQDAFL